MKDPKSTETRTKTAIKCNLEKRKYSRKLSRNMNEDDDLPRRVESRPVEVSSFAALSDSFSITDIIISIVDEHIRRVLHGVLHRVRDTFDDRQHGIPWDQKCVTAYNVMKIVLIGPAQVGKSSFLSQLRDKYIPSEYVATIGVDFMSHRVAFHDKIDDPSTPVKHATLQLWDTAGQERFRAVARSMYHAAVGHMFFFSVRDKHSFEEMQIMVEEAVRLASPGLLQGNILVGTKAEVVGVESRQVSYDDALRYATKMDMPYVEVSYLPMMASDCAKRFPSPEDVLATLIYHSRMRSNVAIDMKPRASKRLCVTRRAVTR
eukprot:PhF_6_TR13690/c1_g1_i1/m.22054/K07874/RAB1A; Ras-related protein Rab-1A